MKVIIDGLAWLDGSSMSIEQRSNLRTVLTIYPRRTTDIAVKEDPPPILMYKEDPETGRIGVPRGFYLLKRSKDHDEDVRVSYGEPMSEAVLAHSNYKTEGPFKEQAEALKVMLEKVEELRKGGQDWGGFILKAGCGVGKTEMGIEFARRLGRRTLVIVHKEFLLRQWRERILKLCPRARIGIVQQEKCEFENCDFVIGMMQSIARDEGRYSKNFRDGFNLIITDEMHHLGAGVWSDVVRRFSAAWRLGLSATVRRLDGAEDVFFYHIGEIGYSATSIGVIPKIRRVYTETTLKEIRRGNYKVEVDNLNSAQILSQITKDEFRIRQVADEAVSAVRAKRKVMIISHRLEHLRKINEEICKLLETVKIEPTPILDFYTGEWFTGEFYGPEAPKAKRGQPKLKQRSEQDLQRAECANILLCTWQIISEGVDVQALDVLILTTPSSDVEQAVGRVRRWCTPEEVKCRRLCPWRAGVCTGKTAPIVVDVIDEQIPQCVKKAKRRATFYRKIGATS